MLLLMKRCLYPLLCLAVLGLLLFVAAATTIARAGEPSAAAPIQSTQGLAPAAYPPPVEDEPPPVESVPAYLPLLLQQVSVQAYPPPAAP